MSTVRLLSHLSRCTLQSPHRTQLLCRGLIHQQRFLLGPTATAVSQNLMNFTPLCVNNQRLFTKSSPDRANKSDTKASPALADEIFGVDSKLGLFAKFKLMYKKYWYVLIPVHVVTSIGWFSAFYYMSKSGVDIPSLLHHLHVSESIVDKFQHSNTGHLAIAYLCYKVATPLRYAVTLGGTTVSIKYLVQSGYIKPLPTKQEILKLYEQKKAHRAAVKANKFEEDTTKSRHEPPK